MSILDVILLPFVFIYRGFILILLLPYYVLLGIVNFFKLLFGSGNSKQKAKTIPELKPGEKVKVVKKVRSAYDAPVKKEVVKTKEEQEKEKAALKIKHQKEFEKMVAKARAEEKKRIKEQEKLRKERERKEKEQKARELER